VETINKLKNGKRQEYKRKKKSLQDAKTQGFLKSKSSSELTFEEF